MKKAKSLLLFIPSIENGGVEKNLYLIVLIKTFMPLVVVLVIVLLFVVVLYITIVIFCTLLVQAHHPH